MLTYKLIIDRCSVVGAGARAFLLHVYLDYPMPWQAGCKIRGVMSNHRRLWRLRKGN